LPSSVSKASPRVFCGVQLHGLLADESLKVVDALLQHVVRRRRREDAMGLLEQLLTPPADDRVRQPMLTAQRCQGAIATQRGQGDLRLETPD